MNKEYICIPIDFREHWVWMAQEPYNNATVFIDLLLRGEDHEDYPDLIPLSSVHIGYIKRIADDWRWTLGQTHSLLETMEKTGGITFATDDHGTHVVIIDQEKMLEAFG